MSRSENDNWCILHEKINYVSYPSKAVIKMLNRYPAHYMDTVRGPKLTLPQDAVKRLYHFFFMLENGPWLWAKTNLP